MTLFDFSQASRARSSQPQYVREGFFGQLPRFDSSRNLSTLLVVAEAFPHRFLIEFITFAVIYLHDNDERLRIYFSRSSLVRQFSFLISMQIFHFHCIDYDDDDDV